MTAFWSQLPTSADDTPPVSHDVLADAWLHSETTATRIRIWHRGPASRQVKLWPEATTDAVRAQAPDPVALERLITHVPERLASTLEWLKRTARQQIGFVSDPVTTSGQVLYCKVSQQPGRWRNLLARFWPSLVANAFQQAQRMRQAGVLTPRAWMAWEWEHPDGLQSGLITETISRAVTLDSYLRRGWQAVSSQPEWIARPEFYRILGRSLRTLHSQRFDHRDLKAGNLLIRGTTSGLEIWYVDLDGVRRWWCLPRIRRIQNLARLAVALLGCAGVTRSDLLRGLVAYLGPHAGHWQGWWREIAQRVRQKQQLKSHETSAPKIVTPPAEARSA